MNISLVTLDVRADIGAGHSPLAAILEAVAKLGANESLRLLAPFEPVPLYELLGRQGFRHAAKLVAENEWEILFTREPGATLTEPKPGLKAAPECSGSPTTPRRPIELDARGLEPPQPLVRVLEALAELPLGTLLRARTDRRPMHLYAQLEARGFTGESEEQSDGSFVTQIRRR